MAEEAQSKLTVGDEAQVPDKPVRVKISYGDGKWVKSTLNRIPAKSELGEGESIEVLDEPTNDEYDAPIAPEYGEGKKAEAKKAAAADKNVEAPK